MSLVASYQPTAPEPFAAIAHPLRRRILDLLRDEELPVNELARHFQVSRPAVSQHLRFLLDSGLVAQRRQGREQRYRLRPERLAEIHDWLSHYERFWDARLHRLHSYLKENQ
jgi:DNA-binding transcriptional ArsR family regulator